MRRYLIIVAVFLFLFFPSFVYAQNQYSNDLKELNLYANEKRWFIANTLLNEMVILFPEYSEELRGQYFFVTDNYRRSLDAELLYDVNLILDGFKKVKSVYQIKLIQIKTSIARGDSSFLNLTISIEDDQAVFNTSHNADEVKLDVIENFIKLSNELIADGGSFISTGEEDNNSVESYGTVVFEYESRDPDQNENFVVEYEINAASMEDYRLYLFVYYLYYWVWPRF